MEDVTVMTEKINVMISEEEINEKVKEIGKIITEEYEGESVHLICILRGSIFFTAELAKRIDLPVTIDCMSASSYGNDTKSSGTVRIKKDIEDSIEGKNVIIIEDIIDSGRTLNFLYNSLLLRKPKSLRLCTLLDKPDRREVEVKVDYTGFTIPDKFVVGFGLDYAQKYRNLPYIGEVEFVD